MTNSNINPLNIGCAAWGWREVEIPEYFHWISNQGIRSVEVNAHPHAPKHLLNDGDDECQWKDKLAETAGLSF